MSSSQVTLPQERIALIADSHLGGPGGDGRAFCDTLRSVADRGCQRLILMGDIFHVWVGYRKFETPEIRLVTPVLEELVQQGIHLEYIEGNRDFFLAGSPWQHLFSTLGTEITFEAAGQRILCVHGDGLNDRDRQYLFWRWLSKSPLVRLFVAALPGFIARRLMHSTEQKLARTNFKHRRHLPEEAIRGYGERRFREGHQVLYLGHFHEPHTWQVPGGEIRLLDAWFNNGHVEWVD